MPKAILWRRHKNATWRHNVYFYIGFVFKLRSCNLLIISQYTIKLVLISEDIYYSFSENRWRSVALTHSEGHFYTRTIILPCCRNFLHSIFPLSLICILGIFKKNEFGSQKCVKYSITMMKAVVVWMKTKMVSEELAFAFFKTLGVYAPIIFWWADNRQSSLNFSS